MGNEKENLPQEKKSEFASPEATSEMDAERQAEANALYEAVENDKTKYGYGERICMNCGKSFTAVHFAQICCCDDCKKERKKTQQKRSLTGHMAKLQKRIQELEKELEIANAKIQVLESGLNAAN